MAAYSLLHAALLVVALGALALAAGRLAARAAPGGVERVLAAAVLAPAFAVAEALALGLVGLGTSPWALVLGTLATWGVARATVPPPRASLLALALEACRARAAGAFAGAALAGAAVGATAVLLYRPGLGYDSLAYHLPEALGWLESGHPGAVDFVVWSIPVGNYPLTSEVGLAWLLGLGRSFAPVAALAPALAALAALAVGATARWLGAPRWAALGAALAVCVLPLTTLELASLTAGSDLPALAAVLCGLALAVRADAHPRLLGPAAVALGLAVGSKTTAAPLALAVLVLGVLRLRARGAGGPGGGRALVAGVALALVVGAPWYVRNTIAHGWPLWPFTRGPTGDPLPPVLGTLRASLLDDPGRTLGGHEGEYLGLLGGGALLLVAAPVLALVARRRHVVVAGAATVGGLLIWAAAPVTGRSADPLFGFVAFTTLRYLLPTLALAAVGVALAAAGSRLRAVVALVSLAAIVCSAVAIPGLEPYDSIAVWPVLLGMAAGIAVVGAVSALGRAPRVRPALALAAVVLAGMAMLVVGSSGWVARHARTPSAWDAGGAAFLAAQPAFHERSREVAMAPQPMAALAGEHLQHRVVTIPPTESCDALRARLDRGWIAFGAPGPRRLVACLAGIPPAFVDAHLSIWPPRA